MPYQQVDFDFVTKKGYGAHVLQRTPENLNALGAAAEPPPAASETH